MLIDKNKLKGEYLSLTFFITDLKVFLLFSFFACFRLNFHKFKLITTNLARDLGLFDSLKPPVEPVVLIFHYSILSNLLYKKLILPSIREENTICLISKVNAKTNALAFYYISFCFTSSLSNANPTATNRTALNTDWVIFPNIPCTGAMKFAVIIAS